MIAKYRAHNAVGVIIPTDDICACTFAINFEQHFLLVKCNEINLF